MPPTGSTRGLRDFLRLMGGGVIAVGIAAAVLWLRLPAPFLWIWGAGILLSLALAMRCTTSWIRSLLVAGFGVALCLACLEGAFILRASRQHGHKISTGTRTEAGYYVHGGELGYGPAPGARVTSRVAMRADDGSEKVLYDVVYTIDDEGARATQGGASGDAWIFMGCSMTFGEGLEDDETLPSRFAAELGGRDQVVNLGFHGYGTHQVLRALETGMALSHVHAAGRVRQVIYQAIPDHAWRAGGHAAWDVAGPLYVLHGDDVEHAGPFHGRASSFALRVVAKSAFLDFVATRTLNRLTTSDEDVERMGRMVARCARVAREQLGAGFTVLYWDQDTEPARKVLLRLRETGVPIVLVSDLVPRAEWPGLIIPGDGHPGAEMNRRLAAGLAARLAAP